MKSYSYYIMGKKKKYLKQEERKDLKDLSGIVLPFSQDTLGVISELEYPYKKWIKVEGMGFEPTNP
jgi:hypothetical protein